MREPRTLKGLFPEPRPARRKNFIKENVKNLRRMERSIHSDDHQTKEMKVVNSIKNRSKLINSLENDLKDLKLQPTDNGESLATVSPQKNLSLEPLVKGKKVANKRFAPKPVCRSHKSNNSKSEGNLKQDIIATKEDGVSRMSKGVQTMDSDDLDVLYAEGVIRYCSGKSDTKNSPDKSPMKSLEKGDSVDVPVMNTSEVNQNTEMPSNDSTDFIKLNKQKISQASKPCTQANCNSSLNNHKIGVVPKYLKERKEALEKERLARIQKAHSDCPEGYVALPDQERLETLSILKKNYKECVGELNLLPIRSDTLKSRKRKMEIEKQLTKLEEAIKVFSRPKVFVAVDS